MSRRSNRVKGDCFMGAADAVVESHALAALVLEPLLGWLVGSAWFQSGTVRKRLVSLSDASSVPVVPSGSWQLPVVPCFPLLKGEPEPGAARSEARLCANKTCTGRSFGDQHEPGTNATGAYGS
jgi:hypothetical protein